jgi:hypothetical protein
MNEPKKLEIEEIKKIEESISYLESIMADFMIDDYQEKINELRELIK